MPWTKHCILSIVGDDGNSDTNTFQIAKPELYVPVVTRNTNDNKKLCDFLSKGFKRSVFWNEYKSKSETQAEDNNLKRILLDSSFQGVNRMFVLAYNGETVNRIIHMNNPKRYALPRVDLTKFNVLIDGRNFYEELISDKVTKYEEVIKLTTGKGKDYITGCLLDYKYYKDPYSIIACDLSKQKELIADPRIIQQIETVFMLKIASQVLTILERSKETVLEFVSYI